MTSPGSRISRIECDAVLFDLDGVLIDSTRCVERHWKNWAARHGLNADDVIRIAHGVRNIDTMRRLVPDSNVEQEAEDFAAMEVTDTEGVVPVEGAAAMLSGLDQGRWAVVTSCGAALAEARLHAAQLPRPPLLITGSDVARGKPEPEPYLLAAQRLGFSAAGCLVVEDAPAGIQAGKRAGMRVVAIAATYAAEELAEAGADLVVEKLTRLRVQSSTGTYRYSLAFT